MDEEAEQQEFEDFRRKLMATAECEGVTFWDQCALNEAPILMHPGDFKELKLTAREKERLVYGPFIAIG